MPAHAFDIAELTELTPALDTATATHDVEEQASEALAAHTIHTAGLPGDGCKHGC